MDYYNWLNRKLVHRDKNGTEYHLIPPFTEESFRLHRVELQLQELKRLLP